MGLLGSWGAIFAEETDSSPAPPVRDPAAIRRLIQQLDHDDFLVREKATAALIACGKEVNGVLREALQSSSAEIRSRVSYILQQIELNGIEAIRQRWLKQLELELDCFLNKPEEKFTLPAWKEFSAIVGDTPTMRKYFASCLRKHAEMLYDFESQPKDRASRLQPLIMARIQQLNLGEELEEAAYERELTAFYLLHEMTLAVVAPEDRKELETAFGELVQELSFRIDISEATAKLYFHHLKSTTEEWQEALLEIASEAGWNTKSRPVAVRALRDLVADPKQAIVIRGQALLVRAAICEKTPAGRAWFESLLDDETVVGMYDFGDSKITCETQLRDLALLALVQHFAPLKQRKFKTYGFAFVKAGFGREDFIEPEAFGFSTPAERTAALTKWKEVAAEIPEQPAKKKKKK